MVIGCCVLGLIPCRSLVCLTVKVPKLASRRDPDCSRTVRIPSRTALMTFFAFSLVSSVDPATLPIRSTFPTLLAFAMVWSSFGLWLHDLHSHTVNRVADRADD